MATTCISKTVIIKSIVAKPNSVDPKMVANKIIVCTPTLSKKKEIKKRFRVG